MSKRWVVGANVVRALKVLGWDHIQKRPAYARRMVFIYQWGRDCDRQYEQSVTAIPAGRRYYEAARRAMLAGAEGPCGMTYMSQADVLAFINSYEDSDNDGDPDEYWDDDETV